MIESIEKPSTELTLPQRAAVALGAAKHEIELREMVKASASIVAVTNQDGREQAHRAAMALRNARTGIAATGKAAREDATAFSKAVIAEEKRLIEIIEPEETRVFALRDKFDAAVAAERQAKIDAERARVALIQEHISDIRAIPAKCIGKSAALIEIELCDVTALPIDEIRFAEFIEEARKVRHQVMGELRTMMEAQRANEVEGRRLKAEREAEDARLAEERIALAKERAELAERAAQQDRMAKAARDEADRVRKLEDEARQHRMNQERDAMLADRAVFRLQQQQLAEAQAAIAASEAERFRLQTIADQALADARKPVEMPLAVTTEPADDAAVEHFKAIVAELLIERTSDEVRALLEEVLTFAVDA